jgi:hypothetical protein
MPMLFLILAVMSRAGKNDGRRGLPSKVQGLACLDGKIQWFEVATEHGSKGLKVISQPGQIFAGH